jgi:hypothetical protein
MTEDELKQLIAWLESPTAKKYQSLASTCATTSARSWSPRCRPLDPKLMALDGRIRTDPRRSARGRAGRTRGGRTGPAGQQVRRPNARVVAPPAADLESLRGRIDAIDASLLGLLNRRAEVATAIGALKRAEGSPAFRPSAKRR